MSEPSIIERNYEGWDPSVIPVRYRAFADFLDRVAADAGLAGELEDIRAQLPEDLQPILG
jgi:hypothetical protein